MLCVWKSTQRAGVDVFGDWSLSPSLT